MKILFALITCIISLQTMANGKQTIEPKPMVNSLLVRLLTLSESETIYGLPKFKTNFGAKLYSIGKEGNCVPETHFICSYEYYLALYEYGDPGELAVFYLGEVGKIEGLQTIRGEKSDSVVFNFKVFDYPEYIKERKYLEMELNVSLDNSKFVIHANLAM